MELLQFDRIRGEPRGGAWSPWVGIASRIDKGSRHAPLSSTGRTSSRRAAFEPRSAPANPHRASRESGLCTALASQRLPSVEGLEEARVSAQFPKLRSTPAGSATGAALRRAGRSPHPESPRGGARKRHRRALGAGPAPEYTVGDACQDFQGHRIPRSAYTDDATPAAIAGVTLKLWWSCCGRSAG